MAIKDPNSNRPWRRNRLPAPGIVVLAGFILVGCHHPRPALSFSSRAGPTARSARADAVARSAAPSPFAGSLLSSPLSGQFRLGSTAVREDDDGAVGEEEDPESMSREREDDEGEDNESMSRERTRLKRELLQLAASYDRGFGATARARTEADDAVRRLSDLNPTRDAARGIDGGADGASAPLRGVWRMIWTTALDVVSLAASPVAAPAAIYQVIEPPMATNIIDFIPRVQTLFPPSLVPPSLVRAEVSTRASSRGDLPNRVGLVFESVSLLPVEFLGMKIPDALPPLTVDFLGPQNFVAPLVRPVMDSLGGDVDGVDAPGFFDVEYLDDELLVIRQQAPGGVFALVKVDNYDP